MVKRTVRYWDVVCEEREHRWIMAAFFPMTNLKAQISKNLKRLGTRSFAPEQAIGQAIDFHLAIGSKRKAERCTI
jgi:hypothetical protein